ncbi:MAG: RsmD family RNA methyltransferase [Bdellovibrionota bacterium]|jgi:16S rRNA (guanine966-N2)-methyltransferase|nr:RsmD family RNA methyltransferase [Bdellovibrionota bacterium]
MTIKVLGGLVKSRSLFVPKGDKTRPTSVLLKRRIFDAYQDLSGFHFIDLCAGSGAMGIEAWSRGASRVSLVEVEKNAQKAIEQNLRALKSDLSEEVTHRPLKLVRTKVEKFCQNLKVDGPTILFLDPPYEMHKIYQDVGLLLLKEFSQCDIWIESDTQKGLGQSFWQEQGFTPDKVYSQGTSYFAVFKNQ